MYIFNIFHLLCKSAVNININWRGVLSIFCNQEVAPFLAEDMRAVLGIFCDQEISWSRHFLLKIRQQWAQLLIWNGYLFGSYLFLQQTAPFTCFWDITLFWNLSYLEHVWFFEFLVRKRANWKMKLKSVEKIQSSKKWLSPGRSRL